MSRNAIIAVCAGVVVVLALLGWRYGVPPVGGLFGGGVLEKRVGTLEKELKTVKGSVKSAHDRLDGVEGHIVGVRNLLNETVARVGANEDERRIDHNKKLVRISGFSACGLNGDTLVVPPMTQAVKKMLDGLPALLSEDGWDVKKHAVEFTGFADKTPFRRDGKVLPNSDQLNIACADARAKMLRAYFEVSDRIPAIGRGRTVKFGVDLHRNRSGLIYLGRASS